MKKISLILLVVVAVFALYVVNRQDSNKEQVGVLLPLSSDFAWWGETIQNAIAIAQRDGFMSDVEFIYADTKCNTKDAVSGVQYLKNKNRDIHLFVVGCDNDLKAMKPYLDSTKDLAFMVGLSEKSLYDTGVPTINLAYRLESEGVAAAQFAYERLGSRKFGIVVSATDFGTTLGLHTASYFKEIGGETVTETLKYNETNPESALLKILTAKPDTVYIHNDIPGMVAILKRLAQLGYRGNTIVYYGGRDQSLIDTAGKAAEGTYIPWVVSESLNEKRLRFERAYKDAYNKDPFVTAYFVYDGLELLAEARKSCWKNISCITGYFYSKQDFVGTLGAVKYQPNGKVERKFNFQQVRNGKFTEVRNMEQPYHP